MGEAPDITTWDLFVLRHQKPGNLAIHAVSFAMFWFSPLVALVTWNPWWMLAFFTSGGVGALGHYIFDDSGVTIREATSTPAVPFYVGIMFYKVIRGTYWDEVEEAKRKVSSYERARGEAAECVS